MIKIPEQNQIIRPLHERLSIVSEELRVAVDAVIAEVPVAVPKPSEFERVLKLDRTLSSRLLRAIKLDDPLATLYRMPGLQGIKRMLSAAANAGVDAKHIERASNALIELESLVSQEVGTWQDLGAALSGWLPDAREEFELANRQTAHRAMVNLKGLVTGVFGTVRLMHPATDGSDNIDVATILCLYRLKRTRPGVPISIFSLATKKETVDLPEYTLDGNLICPGSEVPFLHEFCSPSTPEFVTRQYGKHLQYDMVSEAVGASSLMDLFLAYVIRDRCPRHTNDPALKPTLGVSVGMPVRTQIVDVLAHEDIWLDLIPEPRLFDTCDRGFADPFDESRGMDRIDFVGSFQSLGDRLDALRVEEIARYTEMIEYVCDKLGWDHSRFRAHRWRVEYPLIGTQCSMVFG